MKKTSYAQKNIIQSRLKSSVTNKDKKNAWTEVLMPVMRLIPFIGQQTNFVVNGLTL